MYLPVRARENNNISKRKKGSVVGRQDLSIMLTYDQNPKVSEKSPVNLYNTRMWVLLGMSKEQQEGPCVWS